MANTFETPNMHMDLPVVQGEVGPLWAQELNTAIGTVIDAHDHTSGNGIQVPVAGLNIDDDLSLGEHNATEVLGVQFKSRDVPSTGTFEAGLFVNSPDLYYQDGAGNNVQLTSGGAIVPSGTGEFNGFYGDYAHAGPSANAGAFYYDAGQSYEFYQDTGRVARASGVFAQLQSIQATQNDFYLATAGGTAGGITASPTGGWLLRSTDGTFTLAGAAAASSSYGTAVQITGLTGSAGDYAFSLNDSTSDFMLSASRAAASAAVFGGLALRVNGNGIAYPRDGLGLGVNFYDADLSKSIGSLHGFYKTQGSSTTGAGGVRLVAAYNGAEATTAGIELVNFSGGTAVGLLGSAVAGQGVTVYGDLVPSASGGLLGTASLPWLIRGTGGTFSGSVTANGFLATGTSAMQTINAATSSTYGLGNAAATWLNVWGDTTRSITHILRDANPSTKTQSQKYDGIVHHAISVSSGGSKVYEYTANNTCTPTKTATGSYDLDFSTALPATQCLFFVSIAENGGYVTFWTAKISQASTTKLQVQTADGSTLTDARFNVLVLSTGF